MSDKQRASPIAIRVITELSEMLAIEELQKVVWGCGYILERKDKRSPLALTSTMN